MTPRIRLATHDDLPVLTRLIDASVRELSRGYYTPEEIESGLTYVFGVDTQLIDDGTYYVIELDGEIAAAGGWSRRDTLFGGDQRKAADDPLLDPAVDAARIRAFFVHPRYTRRGLGRAMFDTCLAAARQHGFKRFELAATLPGEPLYTALGFTRVEHTPVALPDGRTLPLTRMSRPIE